MDCTFFYGAKVSGIVEHIFQGAPQLTFRHSVVLSMVPTKVMDAELSLERLSLSPVPGPIKCQSSLALSTSVSRCHNLSHHNLILLENDMAVENIPLFDVYPAAEIQEPVSFAESKFVQGSTNGAIKVRLSASSMVLFRSTLILDPNTFTFLSTNQTIASPHVELLKRIRFHNELVNYFKKDVPPLQRSSAIHAAEISDGITSSIDPMNALKGPNFETATALLDSPTAESRSSPMPHSEENLPLPDPLDSQTLPPHIENSQISPGLDLLIEQRHEGPQEKPYTPILPNMQAEHVSDEGPSTKQSLMPAQNASEMSPRTKEPYMHPQNTEKLLLNSDPVDSGNLAILKDSSNLQSYDVSEKKLHESMSESTQDASNTHAPNIEERENVMPKEPIITETENVSESEVLPTFRSEMPSFLHRLPTIDKKPVDLYNLFIAVILRGGFEQVTLKKQWAKVGRELGYRGKIMTSLSSSLKSCFQKSLSLFEIYMLEQKPQVIKQLLSTGNPLYQGDTSLSAEPATQDPMMETNMLGKRPMACANDLPSKRSEVNSHQVIRILGSTYYSRRTLSRISSKGFFTNLPFSFDSSRSKTYHAKVKEDAPPAPKKAPEHCEYNVTNSAQLNLMWDHMLKHDRFVQDEANGGHPQKMPQASTLRQFIDRDGRVQDTFVALIPDLLGRSRESGLHAESPTIDSYSHISVAEFESLYWEVVQNSGRSNQLREILDPEICQGLSTLSHESNFCKPGNDVISSKARVEPTTNGNDQNTCFVPHEKFAEACAHPWNLHNVPTSSQSLLGHLDEGDIDDRSLIVPEIDIATAFTTFNWHCHDQYLQSINYLAHGAPRVWYIIPELEASKFQELIEELVTASEDEHNFDMRWIAKDLDKTHQHEDGSYETLLNSLDYSVQPLHRYRMHNKDAFFQELIKSKTPRISSTQDFVITPQMLLSRGIRWTRAVQNVGEVIITYPGAHSCIVSTGFSLSEKIKFASPLWLTFSMKGTEMMKEQCVIPCFPVFKLVSNLIQLHESHPVCESPEYLRDLISLHRMLCNREIESRIALRQHQVKETILDERPSRDSDTLADDDLTQTFPSTVVLMNKTTSESFSISLRTFLDLNEKRILIPENIIAELRLGVSDEKLRVLPRGLSIRSLDYKDWTRRYEDMIQLLGKVLPLKLCKTLLIEGEKISSGLIPATSKAAASESGDEASLKVFKYYLSSLTEFWNEATNFIEDCQSFLSIKHHSRIRKANGPESSKTVTHLMDIALRIPLLNFHCVEMDQILEFKLELENFDKAARAIVCKPGQSYQDFDELINLGQSFGLDIPSLRFMERIYDRLKWIETFELISSGKDPYADKKDVFLLSDLHDFINFGIGVLGEGDEPLIECAKAISESSASFNVELSGILDKKFIDDLDVAQLESITERFGQGKLFLLPDMFAYLSRVYNHLSWIKEYQKLASRQLRMSFQETKYLQRSIVDSKLVYDEKVLSELFKNTEAWIDLVFSRIEKTQIAMNSILADALLKNPSSQQSLSCADKLTLILKQIETIFSDSDNYDRCSSFLAANSVTSDASEVASPLRYCFCRGYEFGTMVECEACKEWYHLSCVTSGMNALIEEENYICIMCSDALAERGIKLSLLARKLLLTELRGFIQQYDLLTVYPSAEGETLLKICTRAAKAFKATETQVNSILADPAPTLLTPDELRFWLRKLYGCGIADALMTSKIIDAIKSLSSDPSQISQWAEPSSLKLLIEENRSEERVISVGDDTKNIGA